MEAEKYYKQVFVRSESDLPRDGQYIAHYKKFPDDSPVGTVLSNINRLNRHQMDNWMNNIDWYLLPIDPNTNRETREMPLVDFQHLLRRNDWDVASQQIKAKLIRLPSTTVIDGELMVKLSQPPATVTDEMIEKWSLKYDEETYHEPEVLRWIQYGIYCGAKALRDGLIK